MRQQSVSLGFRKLLGTWTGALTVLAVVIGAGIYSVPQEVAYYSDSPAMMFGMWLAIGLICLMASMIWAELAARLPYAGSDFLALKQGFGRHVAFLYGWKSLAVGAPTTRAALALVAAEYTVVLVPDLQGYQVALGISIIVILGVVNMRGLAGALALNVSTAVFKVFALLLFVVLTFMYAGDIEPAVASPHIISDQPLVARLCLASLLIFFSYTGWTRINVVAEEFSDPGRQMIKSMIISMLAAIVLYLLVNAAYLHALGMDGIRANAAVGSATMDIVFGHKGAVVFALLVVVSVIGSMSVSIMSSGRVYYAMAKSGTFFKYFGHLGSKSRVPERAIFVHIATAVIMLVLRQNFVDLMTTSIFINMIFFSLRVGSLFNLRKEGIGDDLPGFRIPWYPILPALVLVFMVVLLIIRVIYDWERAWFDVALLGVGIPASLLWFRIRDKNN